MTASLPGRLSARTPRAVVGTVSFAHFLSHVYFLSFPPLFPLLYSEFDASYAELGLLVSSLYAAMFVFQIPFGWVVDRGYAKHTLVAGLVLTAGGLVGASTATSYPVLLGFAFLSGIGQATYHPADYALLDVVSAEGRSGRNFSFHTFAGYAGSGVAPLLVGTIGLRLGWRAPLAAVGAFGLVYALALALLVEPVYRNELDAREASGGDASLRDTLGTFLRPAILATFLLFVALVVGESGIQSFTTVFVSEGLGLTEATGNAALTAFFVLTSAGVLLGGVLADRYDAGAVAVGCLAVAAAVTGVLVTGLAPASSVATLALFAAIGFAYGVVLPSRDRLVADYSPDQSVGKSFGLMFTGAAVGGSIGPVLIGTAIDYTAVAVSMALVGAFFLAGAGVVVLIKLWDASGRTVAGSLREPFD